MLRPPPIPGYTVGPCLGDGATATVFEGRHDITGRDVAMKMVPLHTPRTKQALDSEVLAMARLNHPHVLVLHDAGTVEDASGQEVAWLAMERASGGTYEGWRPASWSEVLPVFEAVTAGLAHAHARGVVHRDLKPANLLRAIEGDERPGPKLADFGLTVVRDHEAAHARGGTPRYMPPEQVQTDRGRVGPWSDLYALGSTLWEWVTGAPPFSGPPAMVMHRQLHSEPPPFRPRFPVPEGLEAMLRQMLAKRPGDRPLSVGALRRALSQERGTAHERLSSIPSNSSSLRSPGLGLALMPLRSPHTVGRRVEGALLTTALQQVLDTGRPEVRLLQGVPGVGRRHVLRWLAESAAEAGLVEVVWNPSDLAEVRALATACPVVIAFETLDAAVEELLASVVFMGLPLLALAPCERRADWPDLLEIAHVDAIDVDPLPDHAIRQLLHVELGVTEDLALRMAPSCHGLPGVARAWLRSLAVSGALVAARGGFDGSATLRAPPQGPVHADLERLLAHTDSPTLAALRAAACCGAKVPRRWWERVAGAIGASPDEADLTEWMGLELVRRERNGDLLFRSEPARDALRSTCTPDQYLAIADALVVLGEDPRARWVRGTLLVDAGRADLARPLLLAQYDVADLALEDRNRRAVEQLRPHMANATVEERVRFQLMDMRTTLNLASSRAALPLADRLRRTLHHLEGGEVSPELRLHALEIVALVYAFEDQSLKASQVLDVLPETPRVLRARGLTLEAMGRPEEAIACLERAFAQETHPQRQARILNGLGSAHGRRGRHGLAAACFADAAAGLDPELRHVPLGNLASALLLDGRHDEALRAARQAYISVAHHGARRVAVSCITFALAAALTDDPELDALQVQALYSLQRWGMSDLELLLDTLRAARPQRAAGRAFLDAVVRHAEAAS